jgi:hypothetical protein
LDRDITLGRADEGVRVIAGRLGEESFVTCRIEVISD